MAKVDIEFDQLLPETLGALRSEGLLLVGAKEDGTANTMTIGWATFGILWGRPICVVLVRPSRYTYEFLEEVPDFTVNVLPKELAEVAAYCGTVSGRDEDKFEKKGLTCTPGRMVKSPIVEEGVIHYECRTVHRNDLIPDQLDDGIKASAYPRGDFHRLYYGQIVASYAEEDAARRVSSPNAY
jgi:flavin reductase (DIM6/NTAB) family NADH-FMN oxidoreductase RutF